MFKTEVFILWCLCLFEILILLAFLYCNTDTKEVILWYYVIHTDNYIVVLILILWCIKIDIVIVT